MRRRCTEIYGRECLTVMARDSVSMLCTETAEGRTSNVKVELVGIGISVNNCSLESILPAKSRICSSWSMLSLEFVSLEKSEHERRIGTLGVQMILHILNAVCIGCIHGDVFSFGGSHKQAKQRHIVLLLFGSSKTGGNEVFRVKTEKRPTEGTEHRASA